MRKQVYSGDDEQKKVRIGKSVLTEDDLEFSVEYGGETFTLAYPNHFERAQIEAEIARKLQGLPRSSFPADHVTFVQAAVYVHALLVPEKSPEWVREANSIWESYDEELVYALYRGYLQFHRDLRERVKSGDSGGGGE